MRAPAPGIALSVLLLGACGSHQPADRGDADTDTRGNAAADTRGDAGAEAGGLCVIEPTGSFTFHVHNGGTGTVIVDFGCGRSLPIVLATPVGRLSIGPGAVDACELTCEQIYGGRSPGGCTDCGGGRPSTLKPGGSVDIEWDRRVYSRRNIEAACANGVGTCAFGSAVAPSTAQLGLLTICPPDQHATLFCDAPKTIAFTLDTTAAEGTIEIAP